MSYEINCPFCKEKIVSDLIDTKNEVDGEWQCNNGHTFIVRYIQTVR